MKRPLFSLFAFAALALLAAPLFADDEGQDQARNRRGPGDFAKRLMENDKNNDGKLSKDEIPEQLRERISRLDRNEDGEIDKEEIEAMAARFREMRERRGDRGPAGAQRESERGRRGQGRPEEGQRRKRPEGDRDAGDRAAGKRPSRQGSGGPRPGGGFRPNSDEIFKRMDADDDGSISKEEFKKAHERMAKMMASRGGPGHGPGQFRGGPSHGRHPSAHRGGKGHHHKHARRDHSRHRHPGAHRDHQGHRQHDRDGRYGRSRDKDGDDHKHGKKKREGKSSNAPSTADDAKSVETDASTKDDPAT